MRTRAQKIRLGIFIMISSVLLLILIGFFTARRLFERTDTYFVAFSDVSVSGLEVGSPVKYLGINVGTIAEIYIDPEDINQVIVRLSLREGTPIKEDASADIVAMGITGLRTIEIRGGSTEADFLEEEQFIRQGISFVDDISGRAEVIAFKVEEVLNNILNFTQPENLDKVSQAVEQVSILSENASLSFALLTDVIEENREDMRNTFGQTSAITAQLDTTAAELQAAIARFNLIMQGEEIGEVLGNLRDVSITLREAKLSELIENLALTAAQTQSLLIRLDADLEEGSKDLSDNLTLLRHTLENLSETSRRISNDPSLLIRGPRARDIPDRKLQ
ncbi:MAG: MCE family protein [Bacteroidetes bacterium]|nr:MAG: MCE family protein [Bacteroidota bacterium]